MLRRKDVSDGSFRIPAYDALGLARRPFSLAPDPAFHFPSRSHGEALEQLLSCLLREQGLELVFGDVGSGKTVLSRRVIEAFEPTAFHQCLIFTPVTTEMEFIAEVFQKLRVRDTLPETGVQMAEALWSYVSGESKKGKRTVIIVDEAQLLSDTVLRFIANLFSLNPGDNRLSLHVLLFAQQDIVERLLKPTMRDVRAAVSLTCYLRSLDRDEIGNYIAYRLNAAGSKGGIRFTRGAIESLYESSQGCPRVLNSLADQSILLLVDQPRKVVDEKIVRRALRDGATANRGRLRG